MKPVVEAFFDPSTFTYSYVVADASTNRAAIIDPVLDYDPASGRTSTDSADRILDYVERYGLQIEWILETHVHADHLTAAAYMKSRIGAPIGIGGRVTAVQEVFGKTFNAEGCFATDGSQFDKLFDDGEAFAIGALQGRVMFTPGHTPACVTYVFDGAAFVGDTLFMPDYGTARTDFPGGDANTLYESIQKIFALPPETTLYMCHDYGSETRSEFRFETSVTEERESNKMINERIDQATFVKDREARDAKLAAPKLLYPSVQFNMRGGHLPPAEDNGMHYFKIPVRHLA